MRHSQMLSVALVLLHGMMGTMIKLNSGGFEDIVIAINPLVSEDKNIVDNIKDMVKEASRYLFRATRQRFYFKSVKVLIPLTWIQKEEYRRATIETYEDANVIVANSNLKYGDDPYTLQYGPCGMPGRFIHFTPKFLTNDNLKAIYGPRGRILVHEWAHLRWGVFDEYSRDTPFYAAGEGKVEATRCTVDIAGKYVFPTKQRMFRKCWFQKKTHLYQPGCQFLPEKYQNSPASIMYMQSLPSVTQFCDKSNHNIKAPNMQNKLCDLRSIWEVIMDSTDFKNSSPRVDHPPNPTVSVVQVQERVVCLVLDVSENMGMHNRLGRLKQAALLFLLEYIESRSWVGIITFESSATVKAHLQQIVSYSVRQALTKHLPSAASGGTNVCAGVREGIKMLRENDGSTAGKEIVLLTNGNEINLSSCLSEVKASGSIIHTIALGSSTAEELDMLAMMTGGLSFTCADRLDSTGIIDAFNGIASERWGVTQQTVQLENKSRKIETRQSLNGILPIDNTVGKDLFFVVIWSIKSLPPQIFLRNPKGRQYAHDDFVIDNDLSVAQLKITGIAELGDWNYEIQNNSPKAQAVSITVTGRPVSAAVTPVSVKLYTNAHSYSFPSPVIIYAEVSQRFLPVVGANVIAIVESGSGMEEVQLLDNGAGADIIRHDGIYSRYFTSLNGNGNYNIKVRIQKKVKTTRQVVRQNRPQYIPGWVINGTVYMKPPQPTYHPPAGTPTINIVSSGTCFTMTGVPPKGYGDIWPPCKIRDLVVEYNYVQFRMRWTAPGDDLDSKSAERYEIRMSTNPLELTGANFSHAISVDNSLLKPQSAGKDEVFYYKSKHVSKENATEVYFAIRAIDDKNNAGEISNIAKAQVGSSTPGDWPGDFDDDVDAADYFDAADAGDADDADDAADDYVVDEDNDDDDDDDNTKYTTIVFWIVIIICGSLLILCVLISVLVFILKRRIRPPEAVEEETQ